MLPTFALSLPDYEYRMVPYILSVAQRVTRSLVLPPTRMQDKRCVIMTVEFMINECGFCCLPAWRWKPWSRRHVLVTSEVSAHHRRSHLHDVMSSRFRPLVHQLVLHQVTRMGCNVMRSRLWRRPPRPRSQWEAALTWIKQVVKCRASPTILSKNLTEVRVMFRTTYFHFVPLLTLHLVTVITACFHKRCKRIEFRGFPHIRRIRIELFPDRRDCFRAFLGELAVEAVP